MKIKVTEKLPYVLFFINLKSKLLYRECNLHETYKNDFKLHPNHLKPLKNAK